MTAVITRRTGQFLLFTLAITWILWWILALLTAFGLSFSSPVGMMLFILGGSGPTAAAYLAVLKTPESGSVRQFNRRVLKARVSWRYYLFAAAAPPAAGTAALLITGSSADQISPHLFVPLLLSSVLLGGLEEFGWRGVLQEEMQRFIAPGVLSLIIGCIWALWHLPLFFISGTSHAGSSFALFTLSAVGYSGMLTWLYRRTGSILLCVLFHASINAAGGSGASVSLGSSGQLIHGLILLAVGLPLAVRASSP